ncbi:ATP-binding protein [Nonomuraea sp. K274]|uniref:ATP-binding protein n=1 Tax=Nonomuraea cypriaca TaxID=1187855 RepID=A0A931A4T7_9ACTN|nr:ATP-binding protein [Nonomuraea cypriaca]MBF8184794.1 ATP-binding protein [Nonomuraea cypriaca]
MSKLLRAPVASEEDTVIYVPSPRVDLHELGAFRLALSDRAPYLAREAITERLTAEHPALEIVTLAASELVTNAVRYSNVSSSGDDADAITLELSQAPNYLRLAVTDPGSVCTVPTNIPPQTANLYSEHGRGLAIVERLSRGRWGSHQKPPRGLRLVWCHLDRQPTPAQLEELFSAPV